MRKVLFVAILATLLLGPAGDLVAAQGESDYTDLYSGLEYRMVGPSRGGRATTVAGHRTQPHTFYQGATGGGVWKTTDYGDTWYNISDGYFATGSIGSIRVADSDANIIYVSTGSDGLRSNVIIGKGVYKSTDAGKTWKHVGLEKTGNSGAVLIHPTNPNLVYVAAIGNPFAPNPERGIYRTKDGGANWEHVFFISEKTGAVDLEFAPDNPNEIYASMWLAERKPWTITSGGHEGGVYKSTDGGDNWKHLTNGLPNGLRGKSDLAVSAGDPKRVYVLIEAPAKEGGVYRSDDRGETWTQVTDFQPIRNRPFYYTNLVAHPKNPDILWGMAEGYFKSTDAGKTWERKQVPHGDNHDMWINPDNPDIFIQSNDGGANVTLNGGMTWSTQHNQPTAELYQVDVSDSFPYRLYAGQQDNTTISVPSHPPMSMPGGWPSYWEAQGGCETGPAVPKPGDPDIVYANCKGRFGYFNRRTGQEMQYYVGFWNIYGHNPKDLAYRFQRVVPIHVSPHDPNKVYHGSQYVHMTTNGGQKWETISPDLTAFSDETQVFSGDPITIDITGEEHFSVLYDIRESPHEAGVIWAGANDGPIHVTRDGGKNWKEVTPPGLGPYGRVQTIEVSPHKAAKVYVSVLRYQVGDFEPHAYKTEDYGETWTRITTGDNGVPNDHPVRVVREDPNREGLLYLGTEFGMFISFDDGGHWQSFQQNLPATPVTDIEVVNRDLALSTMGRSFWILYDLTPLHEINDQVASADIHLFKTDPPYRLFTERRFGRREPLPHEPQYPPAGANIDYYVGKEPAGEIKLEIVNPRGQVIRTYSSEGPATMEMPTEPSLSAWHMEGVGTAKLPKTVGMHRFRWDLRYPGPWDTDGERSGRFGPLVPPGTYQAKLTVGDRNKEVPIEVKMDPRVVKEGITVANVTEQIELALKARDGLSNVRLAAEHVKKELESQPDNQALMDIKKELITAPIRYSQPMLVDQMSYLYMNLNTADQKPGQDAIDRYEELSGMLEEQVNKLKQVIDTTDAAGN